WQKFMNGLPTTPVHDLKIHPRERELIAGTHGRSIWIVDVAPLQQYSAQLVASVDPVMLELKPALAYQDIPVGGESPGQQVFAAQSPPFGAEITYWIPTAAVAAAGAGAGDTAGRGARAQVIILNEKGDTMQTVNGPATRGLQRAYWNLRKRADPRSLSPAEKRDSALLEVRVAFVSDSLVKAGMEKPLADRLINRWRTAQRTGTLGIGFGGGGGGAGGGGAGQASITTGGPLSSALDTFNARPGETTPRAPGAAATPAATETEPEGQQVTTDQLRMIVNLLRLPDRATLRPITTGGGGFLGQQPLVEAGTYTAVLKIGDKTSTRTFVVVKPE
ncbi:MAG: hypothetical protein ACT4O1_02280, partial [Gemmatimonadota bacterium]